MFKGHLDQASHHRIRGWAAACGSTGPALVHIHIDGELVASLTADRPRDDLAALLGSTEHGFELSIPGLSALRRYVISARVDGEDEDLLNSPLIVEAAETFDDEVELSLSRLVVAADVPTLDRAARVLSELIDTIVERRVALASCAANRATGESRVRSRPGGSEGPSLGFQRRALVIVPSDPPASEGFDGFLTINRVVSLRRLGFEVAVAALNLEALSPPQSAFLIANGIERPRHPYTASIEELLRRQQGALNVVLFVGREAASRYIALAESLCPSARIVYAATAHDLVCLDIALAVNGIVRWPDDVLASDRFPTILPASKTGLLDPRKTVVSWSEPAAPGRTSFQHRRGIVMLDDAASFAPILLEHLSAALDIVRAHAPAIPIAWRHAPPAAHTNDAALHKDATIADIAERARLAVTLRTTPDSYRDAAACFAAGLPCVASPRLLRDLGLPDRLVAPDTSTAAALAAAILRLHEDAAHNAHVRKRSLDEIDMRHAPNDVDAALKLALRAARGPQQRDVAAMVAGVEAEVC